MNNPPILLEKKCSRCNQTKPVSEFGKRKAEKWRHENFNSQCKGCERYRKNEYMNKYRIENRLEIRERDNAWRKKHPDRVRNMNLKKIYGITNEEYDRMLIEQNYECKICKVKHQPHSRESRLHIDHCHKSTKIRGLLCGQCNKGLGHFRDDPGLLLIAIAYLKKHSS